MNNQKYLLSLITIPSLLFLVPNISIASTSTTLESENLLPQLENGNSVEGFSVIENQPSQLSQAPDYEFYQKQILQQIINALIDDGEFNQALDIINTNEIDEQQTPHLKRFIAVRAAHEGEFAFAQKLANSLENEDLKIGALGEIAISLAEAGKTQEALQIIQALPEEFNSKMRILGTVASSLATQGEIESALEISQSLDPSKQAVLLAETGALEDAFQLAESLKEVEKTETLGSMAIALAKGGEFDQGIELAKSLPKSSFQGFVLLRIVNSLTEAEQWTKALEVAQLIQDDYSKEDTLTDVPSGIGSFATRNEAFFQIAMDLKEAGKLDQALQVARSIDDESDNYHRYRSSALESIAVEYAIAGKFDKALEITRSTEGKYDDAQVAVELAKLGKLDEATEFAESIEDPFYKLSILSEIAGQLTIEGKVDEAIEVAQSLDEEYQQGIFSHIVTSLAESGTAEQLKELPQKVPESQRNFILGRVAEELVLKDFDQAVEILQSVEDDQNKTWVIRNMAVKLTNDGQLEKGLQLSKLANIPYYDPIKANLYREVAVNFAKLGDFDRALEVSQIIDESLRWRALGDIAIELAAAGKVKQSLTLVESVDQYQDELLSVIASKLAETGQIDAALELSEKRNDGEYQTNILGGVAVGLASNGELSRALEIVEGIEDESVKVSVMGQIAYDLVEAEKFAQGMEITQTLHKSASKTNSKAFALQRIAIALATAKQFDSALEVVEMLNFESEDENPIAISGLRSSVLRIIATSQAEAGNIDEALKMAEPIPIGDRILVINEVNRSLIKSGETNRAIELAQSLDQVYIESALGNIAIALAGEGQVDEGLEIARSLKESQQVWVMGGIVEALVEQGKINQAEELVKSISDYPSWALSGFGVKLAQKGEIDKAIEIAESIQDPNRDLILTHVAAFLIEQGELARVEEMLQSLDERQASTFSNAIFDLAAQEKLAAARQLAQLIPNNPNKARALTRLASDYIEAGEKEEAMELLNQALSLIASK